MTKTNTNYNQPAKTAKKIKQKKSPPPEQIFIWKDNFDFDDDLYQKAKALQKERNPLRKCPYCNARCSDINKNIRKMHKGKSELPVVEPRILRELNKSKKQPTEKKPIKKKPEKMSIVRFTEYLKTASKSKIKKLLYLRWNATKSDVSFLEYVGKHNILFIGNFDKDTVEVRML